MNRTTMVANNGQHKIHRGNHSLSAQGYYLNQTHAVNSIRRNRESPQSSAYAPNVPTSLSCMQSCSSPWNYSPKPHPNDYFQPRPNASPKLASSPPPLIPINQVNSSFGIPMNAQYQGMHADSPSPMNNTFATDYQQNALSPQDIKPTPAGLTSLSQTNQYHGEIDINHHDDRRTSSVSPTDTHAHDNLPGLAPVTSSRHGHHTTGLRTATQLYQPYPVTQHNSFVHTATKSSEQQLTTSYHDINLIRGVNLHSRLPLAVPRDRYSPQNQQHGTRVEVDTTNQLHKPACINKSAASPHQASYNSRVVNMLPQPNDIDSVSSKQGHPSGYGKTTSSPLEQTDAYNQMNNSTNSTSKECASSLKSVEQRPGFTNSCSAPATGGWIQINNTKMPYVYRNPEVFLLPLVIITEAAKLDMGRSPKIRYPTDEELHTFHDLVLKEQINVTFNVVTRLVDLLDVIELCGSSVYYVSEPSNSIHWNDKDMSPEGDPRKNSEMPPRSPRRNVSPVPFYSQSQPDIQQTSRTFSTAKDGVIKKDSACYVGSDKPYADPLANGNENYKILNTTELSTDTGKRVEFQMRKYKHRDITCFSIKSNEKDSNPTYYVLLEAVYAVYFRKYVSSLETFVEYISHGYEFSRINSDIEDCIIRYYTLPGSHLQCDRIFTFEVFTNIIDDLWQSFKARNQVSTS